MAEKEPKPKTPRARSTTTKKVARKTATKKTTTRAEMAKEEVEAEAASQPIFEEVRPTRSERRKGMSFGFLLSSFALLAAASAAAVYVGYTAEGQINVAQRLAEAPANFGEDGLADDEEENDSKEQIPQGIPFGTLEMAGDAAVPPPPPVPDQATTTEATASSIEAVSEDTAPEAQVEGVESSEPAPIEAVTPEEAAATQ